MVVPFLVKQFAQCAPAMLATRANAPAAALTRRTFLTTARLQFTVTPSSQAARTKAASAGKKTTDKASSKKKSPEPKPKKVVELAERTKTNLALKQLGLPPKKPLPVYAAFYMKYLQDHPLPQGGTREGFIKSSRDAAVLWNSYTDVEKQPYYDEFHVAMEQHKKDLDEYWKDVSTSKHREMNKLLRAKGKLALHRPSSNPETHVRRPVTSFFRYLSEFRHSDEGQELLKSGERPSTKISNLAGKRWRAMSEAEKFPYQEASKREREEYRQKYGHA